MATRAPQGWRCNAMQTHQPTHNVVRGRHNVCDVLSVLNNHRHSDAGTLLHVGADSNDGACEGGFLREDGDAAGGSGCGHQLLGIRTRRCANA
eukprot:1156756-Pelagomonas_calceolata.AAC.4